MSRESREVRERFKRGSTENQGKVERGSGEGAESQGIVDIESGEGPEKVRRRSRERHERVQSESEEGP